MNENSQLIQKMYTAFAAGDIPAIMAHVAPHVVWTYEAPAVIPYSGTRHGPKEVLGFFEGIAQSEVNMKLEITEFIAEGDKVATQGRYTTTVKATGKTISIPVAHFFTVQNGKVTRFVLFGDSAAMVAARTPAAASVSQR